MRHLSATVLALALCTQAAHAQQPFERLGVKVPVLTLSNGRYPEFFPNDSLRRVGSVVYNRRLHRIAYLLPADSLTRPPAEVTSRWFSPDPLAEEDNFISPYAFARDNAIRYNDPDGRKVVFAAGVSEQFKKDFAAAVKYLNAHGVGGNLATLQKSKEIYYIGEGGLKEGPHYSGKTRTITWNSRTGAKTTADGKTHALSPAILLNHEADHGAQHDKNPEQYKKDREPNSDPQYDTKEERRVITGSEQETARKTGEIGKNEVTRRDHQPGELFETAGSTSNKPAPPPPPDKRKEQKQ